MNARIYALLSILIPGMFIYLVVYNQIAISYVHLLFFVHGVFVLVFGYLINILSTWLEWFYFITWCGRPSSRLLNGGDTWRVRFYHGTIAKAKLQLDFNSYASNEDLFRYALRYVQGKSRKINEFHALYRFSRNLLTAFLVSSILLLIHFYQNRYFCVVLLPCLLIVWFHCKQIAYCHAREVLRVYIKSKMG